MKKIKSAGFDGVEIHTVGHRTSKSVLDAIHRAQDLDLGVTVHQGWSLDENPTHNFNKWFNKVGLLPKKGYTLEDNLMPMAKDFPCVVYADRIDELDSNKNWWVQTSSHFNKDHSYRTSYSELVSKVTKRNLNVTFDTQHCLEVKLDVPGVEGLPTNEEVLMTYLMEAWDDLGKNVKEIHLCDSNPSLGHDFGRNVFPGTGVMPLQRFVSFVRRHGWSGIITPEVSPLFFLKHSLVKLRQMVDDYLEQ